MKKNGKNRKQIMIVLWKWIWFKDNHVNDTYLSQGGRSKYLADIELGMDKFYRELYIGSGQALDEAIFVAASIFKDGEKAQRVLDQLLKHYTSEDNQVLLFLHRGNGYEQKDVQRILEHHPNIDKCFLFAHGRDFIYYNKRKNCGLLANNNHFYFGRNEKNEYIEIYNKETNTIEKTYFDRVWRYYEHEFQRKIFELKEDLFNELLEPFLLPDKPDLVPKKEVVQRIDGAGKCLKIRIKSFLGLYDEIKTLDAIQDFDRRAALKFELKQLERFERQEGQSYIFDDCRAFLEQHETETERKVHHHYDQLEARMKEIFFRNNGQELRKKDLLGLEGFFTQLINNVMEDDV